MPYPRVDASQTPIIDLSKATKLQDVEFQCKESNVQWIAAALHTAGSKIIHQVSIGHEAFSYVSRQECSDLDSSLVHLMTSHPLRLKIVHEPMDVPEGAVAYLLPQITKRGVVDVVESPPSQPDV